jgi:hypothetical protein
VRGTVFCETVDLVVGIVAGNFSQALGVSYGGKAELEGMNHTVLLLCYYSD